MIQEPSLKDGSFFLPTGERWFKPFLTKKVAGDIFLLRFGCAVSHMVRETCLPQRDLAEAIALPCPK